MSYIKIGKYGGDDSTKPTYQFKVELDEDYVDSTDVYMWFESENFSDNDYLYCRSNVINYITHVGGFNGLTNDLHRELLVQNFCVGKEDRDKLYDDKTQEEYWLDFVKKSELCRHDRWERAKSYASYRLSVEDSNDLGVETLHLNEKYVKYSIESFDEDGVYGLLDWLLGLGIYQGNGFPSKTYFTAELQQGIINILNGIV